jgi:hypothetical protein
MPQDYEVCGYVYRADVYCPAHTVEAVLIREGLEGHGLSHVPSEALDLMARFRGINLDDEYTWDSDDFPKVILGYQTEDNDSHCATCGNHLRSDDVPEYWSSVVTTRGRPSMSNGGNRNEA